MWNRLKDLWSLFGRMFPYSTKPGLRRVGNPGRDSLVLVTCNYELTVRMVIETLKRDGLDAWLLVAPTGGVNVWCAGGAGEFTEDQVISVMKTSGIEEFVDRKKLILPQLAANGVNIWSLRKRTKWNVQFGPADIKDLAAYLERGKPLTQREHRMVKFDLKNRLVMGTNLGFNVALLLIVPVLIASYWVSGLWWKTLPLLFVLSVLSSVLVFWLPGKVGVQKGLALGVLAAAIFTTLAVFGFGTSPWTVMGWNVWILLVAAFVGYDMPSWSPLWRQDIKELVLGVKDTHVEVIADKCIGCHMCDVVCPTGVFGLNPETKKYEVVDLEACEACGACIENCPTDAITNNFRTGHCSCPTCAIIGGVKSVKRSRTPKPLVSVTVEQESCCSQGQDPETIDIKHR
ncbi:MAG: HgcAB-like fusion protein [Phycisphaeraceae bacterium]